MDFIKNMSPTSKSKLIVFGGIVGMVLFFYILLSLNPKEEKVKEEETDVVRIITTNDPRGLGLDAVAARTLALEKEQIQLIQTNKALREELNTLKAITASNATVENEIAELTKRDRSIKEDFKVQLERNKLELQQYYENLINQSPSLRRESEEWKRKQQDSNAKSTGKKSVNNKLNQLKDSLVKRKPSSNTRGTGDNELFSYPTARNEENNSEYRPFSEQRDRSLLMVVESEKGEEADNSLPDINEQKQIYLPTGSILTGVLMTGMDAPTHESAQETPYPALVRLKKEAILPNHYVLSEVKECFALVGGYGKLSTERVMFRGEAISCVKEDGSVIESKLHGYITGEDSKAGLRGKLVTRNSKLLANAMFSGFASGLSSAFNVNPVPVITSSSDGQQQYQSVFGSDAVQGSLAKGASTAMDKLADYFLSLANEVHPSLEIQSGRRVNFVVTKGNEL